MIEKQKCYELFKADCVNMDRISEVAKMQDLGIFEKLEKVYEGIPMTHSELKDLQILLFVIEAIILSEGMRDERLTDLNQDEVENMAFEIYLKVGVIRSQLGGCGYMEMGEGTNEVIKEHLSEKYSKRLDD